MLAGGSAGEMTVLTLADFWSWLSCTKTQTLLNLFLFASLVNLRVEGDGPSDEVDPPEDVADNVQRLRDGDGGQDEGVLSVDVDYFFT